MGSLRSRTRSLSMTTIAPREVVLDDGERLGDGIDSLVDGVANASQQQHTGERRTRQRQDRAEVSVGCDQHALLIRRVRKDLIVGRACIPSART